MFWKNFVSLCNAKGVSPNGVCADLGFSNATATKWKNGSTPRGATLKKLADYFGISTDDLLAEQTAPSIKPNAIFLDSSHVFMIPTFETVSAGFGALANNEIVDYIPLYFAHPSEAEETICIKVKGDSMYPKIEEGDVIQVHKQDTVDSGTIAVVLLDGEEGLVKRVEYGDGWLELHSINPMYKTIRFTGSDVMRIRILGAVRKIIKNV